MHRAAIRPETEQRKFLRRAEPRRASRQPSARRDTARPAPVGMPRSAVRRNNELRHQRSASRVSRDVAEPDDDRLRDDRCRRSSPGRGAIAIGASRQAGSACASRRLAKGHAVQAGASRRRTRWRGRATSRTASQGERAMVEVTTRNSLVKIPKGGSPADGGDRRDQHPAERGMRCGSRPRIVDLSACPRAATRSPTPKKIAGLRQAVHRHVQQAREIRERPAEAERKRDDAHVLDGRIREHPLDVAAPVDHEGRRRSPTRSPMVIISGARRHHRRIAGHDQLEPEQCEHRDVEQQAREHRGDRESGPRRGHRAARHASAPGRPWCRSRAAGTRTPG